MAIFQLSLPETDRGSTSLQHLVHCIFINCGTADHGRTSKCILTSYSRLRTADHGSNRFKEYVGGRVFWSCSPQRIYFVSISCLGLQNWLPCFPFRSFTSSIYGENPLCNISCCFLTDSFCRAPFIAASRVRPESICSFSFSLTFCKSTKIRSRINSSRRVPNS